MGMANGADRPGEAPGFGRMFEPGRLTLGVFFPIEAFEGDRPTMRHQERLARRAEELGFAALWVRDVPLRDPTFGDVGQVYDPWVYLGWIAAQTSTIALATGSIVLTLRHPLHTAKAAASVDRLSGGRLVLGVASGDRPVEFPAFGVDYDGRDAVFRENLRVIREVLAVEFPRVRSSSGTLSGAVDLIPKPAGRLPILVTGSSRQDLDWIAEHSDGWITYPRPVGRQAELAARWRAAVASARRGLSSHSPSRCISIWSKTRAGRPSRSTSASAPAGTTSCATWKGCERQASTTSASTSSMRRGPAEEVLERVGREILPRLESSHPTASGDRLSLLITVATRARPRSSRSSKHSDGVFRRFRRAQHPAIPDGSWHRLVSERSLRVYPRWVARVLGASASAIVALGIYGGQMRSDVEPTVWRAWTEEQRGRMAGLEPRQDLPADSSRILRRAAPRT